MKNKSFVLLVPILLLQSLPVLAQEESQEGADQRAEAPEFLTAVPENPVSVFLGATPTSVTRPGAVRDLGVALLNGINQDGKLQQGFALETTPWFFIPGLSVSLDRYQSNWLLRVLTNAQFSLGTAAVPGDDSSTDLGIGLRLTLYDGTDPMADSTFTDPLGTMLLTCVPTKPPPPPDLSQSSAEFDKKVAEQKAKAQECVDNGMRRAYKDFTERTQGRWNATRVAVAFATGWRFEESVLDQDRHRGYQTWLVGAVPVTRFGQIIGQLTYSNLPQAADADSVDRFNYGARFLAGSASFNAFVELVGETQSDSTDRNSDTGHNWSAGVEFRVATDLWVSTGVGRRFNSLDDSDHTFVIAELRWGLSSKSRFGGLRPAF